MKSTFGIPHAPRLRTFAALLLVFSLIAPTAAIARDKKGEKEFKRGMQHEMAQQWEQAAQEFALAVAAKPSNIEYQLHYRRAVFNASQVFMQKGRSLAEREDYVGAYNAFRQSYGYDPVNQLALAEMERMLRLQREKDARNGTDGNPANPNTPNTTTTAQARRIPASFTQNGATRAQEPVTPAAPEKLRIVNWNGDLEGLIRKLTEELGLNVVFDPQFSQRRQEISLNLRGVTTAQALDIIFQTRGLFFQKLSRRTILVADGQKRAQYQPLALRTFYLKHAKPEDVRTQLAQMFPAQAGRGQIIVVPNKETNSISVRDTEENMRVVEQIIAALDKERAAVVFDVQIYEVSKTDLLQLGGQLGDTSNLGGISALRIPFTENNSERIVSTAAGALLAPTALGAGIILPSLQLSALQDKQNTRLIESTQVHATDGEESITKIGERVPVVTAQTYPFGSTVQTGQTNPGIGFGSGGFPVVNYEDTGLTLKFTPQVFPNQEVQVKMSIETEAAIPNRDNPGTPSFSQRSLTGTARIENNRTMMLASISSNREQRGRQGIPLLGLVPILGRLISTPTRRDRNSDIVIAITPRVLRAPQIRPEDELARLVGAQQTPLSNSLAAVVQEADREDQLAREAAAANGSNTQVAANTAAPPVVSGVNGNSQTVAALPVGVAAPEETIAVASTRTAQGASPLLQLPSAGESGYVPAPRALLLDLTMVSAASPLIPQGVVALPVSSAGAAPVPTIAAATTANTAAGAASLHFVPNELRMRQGERRQIVLMLDTQSPINQLVAMLRFDPKVVAVRSVTGGNFAASQGAQPVLTHSVNPLGSVLASLATPEKSALVSGNRVLLMLEVEALTAGESRLEIGGDDVHFVTPDNRVITKQLGGGRIVVVP